MMKCNPLVLVAAAAGLLIGSCSKDKTNDTVNFEELKTTVITDFTNNVAVPGYKNLDDNAGTLYNALKTLNNEPTQINLNNARTAWVNTRAVWEQCEGFLFGPVEDNDYDPNMDTWPTDGAQMDSLLNSSIALNAATMQNMNQSLRGYHPIEYLLFGDHGSRTAVSLTARQKEYMMALGEDMKATCDALYKSWTAQPIYYMGQVLKAGDSTSVFKKKQELYLAMVGAMAGICEEVGSGKMKEPYDEYLGLGPQKVESPYAGTSLNDFKNNIISLQNVYLGTYKGVTGKGITDLVAAKNINLDNKIKTQITAALNSLDNIIAKEPYYEKAISSQRTQIQAAMSALATLQTTLDGELNDFVVQYIVD